MTCQSRRTRGQNVLSTDQLFCVADAEYPPLISHIDHLVLTQRYWGQTWNLYLTKWQEELCLAECAPSTWHCHVEKNKSHRSTVIIHISFTILWWYSKLAVHLSSSVSAMFNKHCFIVDTCFTAADFFVFIEEVDYIAFYLHLKLMLYNIYCHKVLNRE